MNLPNQGLKFSEMSLPKPTFESLSDTMGGIDSRFDGAEDDKTRIEVVQDWDRLVRNYSSWAAITRLKFSQDTRDEAAKADREYVDELTPKFTEMNIAWLRKLLASEHRPALEAHFGAHAFRMWANEVLTFEPAIQEDLVQESKLSADHTALTASAEIEFDGEVYNLSQLAKFMDVADRDTRYRAQKARWDWVEAHSDEFDEIYDKLVKLRHSMAQKLGYKNYIELGYRRMMRVDYSREDVEVFRKEILRTVVPLVAEMKKAQAKRLGIERCMVWDESVFDSKGNPVPEGDVAELTEKAKSVFDQMHPELSSFYRMMVDRGLLDLESRTGKAGGGFCTSFAEFGVPFIFANFNGTKHDAEVFTHEMGHAFQCYLSMDKVPHDYIWPTLEACEIHSMSLEYFTWPYMEAFFGDDTERFRTVHLTESLSFLPYGTAIDHFQHLVYEKPDATPQERREMWLEMEKLYLPWRDWGDIEYGAKGARWQLQGHVYHAPFYYIDYVLAQTCALQFWDRMNHDYKQALEDYVALCRRGGEASFQSLATSAGLTSPFEPGCLEGAVGRAREYLGF